MKLKYKNTVISKDVEFARTLLQQTLGLMFRFSIPKNYSLLFTFQKPQNTSIHMLFVFFPIDIIFLNKEFIVISTHTLYPFIGYASAKNTQYIIETNFGTIKRFNIIIGSQLQLNSS